MQILSILWENSILLLPIFSVCFNTCKLMLSDPVTLARLVGECAVLFCRLKSTRNQRKLEDRNDLQSKKGHFIGSVNKLFLNLENLQSAVMLKLFQRYCCSFYGSTLWKLNRVCDNELCIPWNKAIANGWRLPPTAYT